MFMFHRNCVTSLLHLKIEAISYSGTLLLKGSTSNILQLMDKYDFALQYCGYKLLLNHLFQGKEF